MVEVTFNNQPIQVRIEGGSAVLGMVARAEAAASVAEDARDLAIAAALSEPTVYASTSAGLSATTNGETFWVDTSGSITLYRNNSGVADSLGSFVLASVSGGVASFLGATNFLLDGGGLGITGGDTAPNTVNTVVHIQNDNVASAGLRVASLWEGSTGSPYTNNDGILTAVYNKTLSNSANYSWAASCSNSYHSIPAGVTDSGERIGCIGWAGSVALTGYIHEGTMASQIGVQGTAGFQASGSGANAIITRAVGVQGRVLVDDAGGAKIVNGYCGHFFTDNVLGLIENVTAVRARAIGGTVTNYSFYGEAGILYNAESIQSANQIIAGTSVNAAGYQLLGDTLIDRDSGYNRFYKPNETVAFYVSDAETLYATATHRFAGAGATPTYAQFDTSGVILVVPTYADNAAAVAGGLGTNRVYKTATGELRIVV